MPSITNPLAIAACNSIVDLVDAGSAEVGGSLVVYDGTPPANVDAPLSGNNVLAMVRFANPSFSDAVDSNPGGRASLLGVPLFDLAIDATGTASFARIFDRDNTLLMQITVGVTGSGAELILNSTALQVGATFAITLMTITMPEA